MAIHEYNFAVSYSYIRCSMITFRNFFALKGKCEGRQNGNVSRIAYCEEFAFGGR